MQFTQYLENANIHLTEQQRIAVTTIDGPVLLLAVPGSGKTTVLVSRLGYMILVGGVSPEQILTLTYTVAATKDMKARFASLFGAELAESMEFRTINGLSYRIIQYYGRRIGKRPYALVKDDQEINRLLSRIYQEVQKEYPAESDLRMVRIAITSIKNSMAGPKEIKEMGEQLELKLAEIYRRYQAEMRAESRMDFDDQMIYALSILKKSPETLQYFQNRYPYVLVDEAQDTSKIQHEIIRLVSGKRDQLFMVGDEDQSIYGFRAAYPEALLTFPKDHPGAKVLRMEDNFRSQKKIVDKADRFIAENVLRYEKHIRSVRPEGRDIRTVELTSRSSQYRYLLKAAADCRSETVVLYRDNESMLPLVDLLERNKIEYRIKNAELLFFGQRTVVDISNIFRFMEDPYDTELFMQIYYKLQLYLTRAIAEQACRESVEHKLPVLDAALTYCHLTRSMEENVLAIRVHFKNMQSDRADQALNRIVHKMGYGAYLDRNKLSDSKIQILRLLSYQVERPEELLTRLKELETILKEKQSKPDCPFILSTIHASKGLEYDTVYLMDVIDGIFPQEIPDISLKNKQIRKTCTGEDRKELETYEEERRIFYVGVTRAKNQLILFNYKNEATSFIHQFMESYAAVKTYDKIRTAQASAKLPGSKQELREVRSKEAMNAWKRKNQSYYIKAKEGKSTTIPKAFMIKLKPGNIIMHRTLGKGCITMMDDVKVRIKFDNGKESVFLISYLYQNRLIQFL